MQDLEFWEDGKKRKAEMRDEGETKLTCDRIM
jgi:hypothetical protein